MTCSVFVQMNIELDDGKKETGSNYSSPFLGEHMGEVSDAQTPPFAFWQNPGPFYMPLFPALFWDPGSRQF